MKSLKLFKVGGILALLITISYAVYSLSFSHDIPQNTTNIVSAKEKTTSKVKIRTTSPSFSKNFSTLLLSGTVQSNETGKVFTRADGIVKDIYSEVGDTVKAGQTLASLLPHGVEGEAEAAIAEKRAMRDKAKVEYENALKLASVTKSTAKTNVETTKLRENSNVSFSKQNILVAKTTLENTQKLLEQAQKTREAKFEEAENEIAQMVKQATISGNNAFQTVNSVIISDKSNIGRTGIVERDFPIVYGALNSNIKLTFISSFNTSAKKKNEFNVLDFDTQRNEISNYLSIIDVLLADTESLLRASVSNNTISQSMIDENLTKIHDTQETLAMSREKLTKAIQAKSVLEKEQTAMITELENTIKEQQSMLVSNEEALKLAEADQTRNSELAEKEKKQIEVEQSTDIAKMQAELTLAEAALASELAKSGHKVIKAPFNGVIAKRNIRVGDVVMNTDAAFEMVETNSSLAKITPAFVQFGAPEDLFNIIQEGNEVEIVIPGQEDRNFKATITRKSSLIDPASRVFTLLATFKDEILLPDNSNVRVRIAIEKDPAWQVPSRSIKRMNGQNYIWIFGENKKPQKILITLLAEDGEYADVRGETIQSTSRVILDPPESFLKKKSKKK